MRLCIAGVKRALIVAPHPDDEAIGAGGLIDALRRQGAQVAIVIVSDGAGSHPNSRSWPRHRLMQARRRESLRSMRRLRVVAANVGFLDLPDGQVHGHEAQCRRKLARIVARLDCDLVVGPSSGDDHPDHRAVARTVARVAPASARHLTYRVWPIRHRRGARPLGLAVGGGAAMKRSLIRGYRTQMGVIRDDPAGFAIAAHELAAFSHPVEHFTEERR